MNRRIALILTAGVAGGVAIANPLNALPPGTEDYNKNSGTIVVPCKTPLGSDGENRIEIDRPPALWPPNHKYYEDIEVRAIDGGVQDPDGFVLTTTGTHNQYEGDTEQNGTGNTGDDVRPEDGLFNQGTGDDGNAEFVAEEQSEGGVAAEGWWARAERSGHKSSIDTQGRQYDFTAEAQIDAETCTASFSIIVPHDMRKSNR